MARKFTPVDACSIVTQLLKMATGQSEIDTVDTSSFTSAGETLAADARTTMNNLSILIANTKIRVKRRKSRYWLVESENGDMYSDRIRTISFYTTNPEPAGFMNTDAYTNLAQGFDNGSNPDPVTSTARSTASMWKMNYKACVQLDFGARNLFDISITIPEYEFKQAFNSAASFSDFLNGMMVEIENDISRAKEQRNKIVALNRMAGIYDMGDNCPFAKMNLLKMFNEKYSTSYGINDVLTTYRKEFHAFVVETVKMLVKWLGYDTTRYHWTPASTDESGNARALLRSTDPSELRCFLYEPFFIESEAEVLPEIFNPSMLDINTQYEGLMYWQSIDNPTAIDVTPAIPDTTMLSGAQVKGDRVQIPYVLGMFFDRNALMTDYQLESSATTPLEAKKMYRNTFWHVSFGNIDDYSMNAVLLYLEEESGDDSSDDSGNDNNEVTPDVNDGNRTVKKTATKK